MLAVTALPTVSQPLPGFLKYFAKLYLAIKKRLNKQYHFSCLERIGSKKMTTEPTITLATLPL